MSTFGERLRAAMAAAGFETPAQLAKTCKTSRQAVEKWLRATKPQLSATHLFNLSTCLRVRMRWLLTGEGIPGWELHARELEIERAISILERLSPAKARKWFDAGERLAKKR